MPTLIELASGTQIAVYEEGDDLAQKLGTEDGLAGLVPLTRKELYQDTQGVDGKPIFVNPNQVAFTFQL